MADQVRVSVSPLGRNGPILLQVADRWHLVLTADGAYTIGRMLIDSIGGDRSVSDITELHLGTTPAGQQD